VDMNLFYHFDAFLVVFHSPCLYKKSILKWRFFWFKRKFRIRIRKILH